MDNNMKLIVVAAALFGGYHLLTKKPAVNPAPVGGGYGRGGGNTYGPPSQFQRGSNTYGFAMTGRAGPGSRGDSNGFGTGGGFGRGGGYTPIAGPGVRAAEIGMPRGLAGNGPGTFGAGIGFDRGASIGPGGTYR